LLAFTFIIVKNEFFVKQNLCIEKRYETVDRLVDLAAERNMYLALNTGWYQEVQKGSVSDLYKKAAVASDRSFALVYSASDAQYILDLTKLRSKKVSVQWYNPRENTFLKYEKNSYRNNNPNQTFNPPGNKGAGHDWVLVLDFTG